MPDETGGTMRRATPWRSLLPGGALLFGLLCFAGGLLAGRHFVGPAPSVAGLNRGAPPVASVADLLDAATPKPTAAGQPPPANHAKSPAAMAPVNTPAPVAAAIAVVAAADLQIGVPADQPPELELREPLVVGAEAPTVRRAFAVRVGAYLKPMLARRRAALLQRHGYHPLILSSRRPAEALTWYSVVLDRDGDLAAARRQAQAFAHDHEQHIEIVSWRLPQPARTGGASAAPPRRLAAARAGEQAGGGAHPWRAMEARMRGLGLASMPAAATLFRRTDRGELDRIAFAVDAIESRHGTDAAMWRPEADGPQGPMQVSAAAALDVGGGDRFDLRQNRILGRAYLAQMFRRYGNWPDALAAYNWGPANVDKWIAGGHNPGQLPPEVAWYIGRVLRDAMITTAAR